MNPSIFRVDARATIDGMGTCASPGSVLVQVDARRPPYPGTLLAAGPTAEVLAHPASGSARVISRPESVLIPGLVNAHTHLDLTHIGPQPYSVDGGFLGWVDMIRTRRAAEPEAIAASVREGVRLSLAGGVVAVGDIAGAPQARPSLVPWETLSNSPMLGVSFLEFFAIGTGVDRAKEPLRALLRHGSAISGAVRLGLQPHAPTTVEPAAFDWAAGLAAEFGLPMSTHLAETPEEREFVGRGTGPQRHFFERLGLWQDRLTVVYGRGLSPVAHLEPFLARCPGSLVAHVNDASDADLDILARTGTVVAYCPRASSYFGVERHFGPHRYRDMLARGIPVVLGTDSIVNLPDSAARMGISTLDEARFLFARDATDPSLLLRMATAGARFLGLEGSAYGFLRAGGPLAGLVGVPVQAAAVNRVDPAAAVMGANGPVELLFGGSFSDVTGTAIQADS